MAPRMHDVVQQAIDCEDKFLSKVAFQKSVSRFMGMVVLLVLGSVGTLITCNYRVATGLTKQASAVEKLSSDQDNTRVYSEQMNTTIVEQGLILESLKTSTALMVKQVDRLEATADRTTRTLAAILAEVRKP